MAFTRRQVRIGSTGRFRAAGRSGRLRYRLRGRFGGADEARIVYRASRPPHGGGGACKVARHRVSLFRNGQPPFRGCRREPAKTLVLGVQGRVFEQRAFDRSILSEDGFAFWPTVYACLFDRSRSHRLGKETVEGSEVIAPHLAGPYVGYAFVRDAGPGGETLSSIRIKDLRDGKTIAEAEPATRPAQRAELHLQPATEGQPVSGLDQ